MVTPTFVEYIEYAGKTYIEHNLSHHKKWEDFYSVYSLERNYSNIHSLDDEDIDKNEVKILDLSNLDLSRLPKELSQYVNLEILILEGNPLVSFVGLSKLKNLKMLVIDYCRVKSIEKILKDCKSLLILSARYNLINSLDLTEIKNSSIAFINLGVGFMKDLRLNRNSCENLIAFHADNNKLKEFPQDIFSLPNIVAVSFDSNGISKFGNIEYDNESLSDLMLVNNRIKELPDNISRLKNISDIHIKANPLEKLGATIGDSKLRHICVSQANPDIFQQITKILSLTSVDISKCSITSIPETIGNLTLLESLTLDNNRISSIPGILGSLSNLEILSLNDNILGDLPQEVSALVNLKILELENNIFTEMPDVIFNMTDLEKLSMAQNYLESIPPNIRKLKNLRTLQLNRNKIESLPKEIGELSELDALMLHKNALESLPPEIGLLQNLEDLTLDNNKLSEYPVELADLQKLGKLYLVKNDSPLDKMPEAKAMGIARLFEYLNKKRGVARYAVEWDVPEQLQTAFQQYLNFFTDYVHKLTGKKIELDVTKIPVGLKLTASTTPDMSIEMIDDFLVKFINYFITDNTSDLDQILENQKINRQQAFELRQLIRDLNVEKLNLQSKVQGQLERIVFLSDSLEERRSQIETLKLMLRFYTQGTSTGLKIGESAVNPGHLTVNVTVVPQANQPALIESSNNFDESRFLSDLIEKAVRMMERKHQEKIEDLHNNDIAHFLRDRQYYVTDQTQSGVSTSNFGELDIMIRKNNGTPVSIIESFRLASCGEKNSDISSHISKLLHNYDTAGLQTNYIIVYAVAKDFNALWQNYISYVNDLNHKPDFIGKYPLLYFTETSANSVYTDLKVGLATHKREGSTVKVYHIFINMSK